MKHLEIENKYLLSYKKALKFIKSLDNYSIQKIKQAYISCDTNLTKRVRKTDGNYILTIKKGEGRIKEEYEKLITKKEYKAFKKQKVGKMIKKARYIFDIEGHKYELDIFKGFLKGLAFLEIEFKDKKELKNFTLPKSLRDMVLQDVSEDRDYSNASLSINGLPIRKTRV